ncbi:hypothetical protein BFS30_20635 [Pedobacter steynii]|uniref:Uncharacterized protein n=1 Tax=Pedobacter steynii TaxID=430522 RepID=A0A1D7QL06_9SPHI|nr:hypothetical protein BFS30_20635 [Pedobacter steynii]
MPKTVVQVACVLLQRTIKKILVYSKSEHYLKRREKEVVYWGISNAAEHLGFKTLGVKIDFNTVNKAAGKVSFKRNKAKMLRYNIREH